MRPYNLCGGRPRTIKDDHIVFIRDNLKALSLRQIASRLGVSHVTIYRNLKRIKYDQATQTDRRAHETRRIKAEIKGEDQGD